VRGVAFGRGAFRTDQYVTCHAPTAIEAERVLEFGQRSEVAEILRRFDARIGSSRRKGALLPVTRSKPVDGLQLRVPQIRAPHGGHGKLLEPPGVITTGL